MKLKERLFEATAKAFNLAENNIKVYGENEVSQNPKCQKQFGQFCSLYTLIEDAGLEEEYQEWKSNKSIE